jgi:hypothetical protein
LVSGAAAFAQNQPPVVSTEQPEIEHSSLVTNWPFKDPPNVAVIANRKIVDGRDWIAYVSHDLADGGWQFHNKEAAPAKVSDAAVVGLREIVQLDETIIELADLPPGWYAARKSKTSPWDRAKIV